jgi:hypothetical protein
MPKSTQSDTEDMLMFPCSNLCNPAICKPLEFLGSMIRCKPNADPHCKLAKPADRPKPAYRPLYGFLKQLRSVIQKLHLIPILELGNLAYYAFMLWIHQTFALNKQTINLGLKLKSCYETFPLSGFLSLNL